MDTYEVIFDEHKNEGVYALSLVTNPAIEDEWIALSKEQVELNLSIANEDKRILLGAALIPNKLIYRNHNGKDFNIVFLQNTIEKIAHSFIKNGSQGSASVNHKTPLKDVSVVESWVVEDPQVDKSKLYGKTYETGTWVCMMKCENEEVWQRAKNGDLKGFSIEGSFDLTNINLSKNEEMKKTILEEIREAIGLSKKIQLGSVLLADKATKIEFEGDAPKTGTPAFIMGEDGEKKPVPSGSYQLEDGSYLYVDDKGLIVEKPEEAKKEESGEEAMVEMAKAIGKLQATIDNMQLNYATELSAIKAKMEQLPAANPIVKIEASKQVSSPSTPAQRLFNAVLQEKN